MPITRLHIIHHRVCHVCGSSLNRLASSPARFLLIYPPVPPLPPPPTHSEPIFSAPDIQRQLPSEAKKFLDIDKGFKNIMRQVTPLRQKKKNYTERDGKPQFGV
jgi:hypothetical protein